jgi:hypothetical protein
VSNPTSRTGSCGLGSSQFWVMRFGPVSSTIGLMLCFGGVLVCLGSHLSVLRLIQSHGAQSALPLWNRTGRQHFVRGMPDLCVLSHPLAGRIRRCPQLRQTLRNSTVIFQKCAGWPSSTSTCVTIGSCLSPQHTHTTWTGSAHWDPSPDWFTQLQKNSCHRMLSAGCKEAAIATTWVSSFIDSRGLSARTVQCTGVQSLASPSGHAYSRRRSHLQRG